eukprot:TRINITY_DN91140_c0_g1_i1.p1 TRINITY_DN91140_c0_g1~~TRINITY_DN91140_c0_g1_i1.p1  ORF type:complete len:621 (+),score=117.19 TRINITY_DN91140_c0_g1_i1:146-2008(+)
MASRYNCYATTPRNPRRTLSRSGEDLDGIPETQAVTGMPHHSELPCADREDSYSPTNGDTCGVCDDTGLLLGRPCPLCVDLPPSGGRQCSIEANTKLSVESSPTSPTIDGEEVCPVCDGSGMLLKYTCPLCSDSYQEVSAASSLASSLAPSPAMTRALGTPALSSTASTPRPGGGVLARVQLPNSGEVLELRQAPACSGGGLVAMRSFSQEVVESHSVPDSPLGSSRRVLSHGIPTPMPVHEEALREQTDENWTSDDESVQLVEEGEAEVQSKTSSQHSEPGVGWSRLRSIFFAKGGPRRLNAANPAAAHAKADEAETPPTKLDLPVSSVRQQARPESRGRGRSRNKSPSPDSRACRDSPQARSDGQTPARRAVSVDFKGGDQQMNGQRRRERTESPMLQVRREKNAALEDRLQCCETRLRQLEHLQQLDENKLQIGGKPGEEPFDPIKRGSMCSAQVDDARTLGLTLADLAADALEAACTKRVSGSMEVFEGANAAVERVATLLQYWNGCNQSIMTPRGSLQQARILPETPLALRDPVGSSSSSRSGASPERPSQELPKSGEDLFATVMDAAVGSCFSGIGACLKCVETLLGPAKERPARSPNSRRQERSRLSDAQQTN